MDWLNDPKPEVVEAFASALNAVENVAKTQEADTGKYTYRYASLDDVLDECKRVCQMFGLAVTQYATADGERLAVFTTLLHKAGTLSFPAMMMRLPTDAQALGSALTYCRRYSLLTIFGIAPEDDDGAAAAAEAKRVNSHGGYRTGAEQEIHRVMDVLQRTTPEVGKALREAFRATFNMGLSSLEPSRHGEALTFVNQWITEREQRAADDQTTDHAAAIREHRDGGTPADATSDAPATESQQERIHLDHASLVGMTKNDLLELGAAIGLDQIPPQWRKGEILNAIVQATDDSGGHEPDAPGEESADFGGGYG